MISSLVLIEIAGGSALIIYGPQVYTNETGTYARELWYGEEDESTAKMPTTQVTPYTNGPK